MRPLQDESGTRRIVFLSQKDNDILIYMSSDVWITPEVKRFKDDLLQRAGESNVSKDMEA